MGGCGALSLTVWTRVQLSCKLRMVAHSQRHARACARGTRRRAVESPSSGLILCVIRQTKVSSLRTLWATSRHEGQDEQLTGRS